MVTFLFFFIKKTPISQISDQNNKVKSLVVI